MTSHDADDSRDPHSHAEDAPTKRSGFGTLAPWEKVLIGAAIVLVVVGLVLIPFSDGGTASSAGLKTDSGPAQAPGQGSFAPETQLIDGQGLPIDSGSQTEGTASSLSPAFLRLGFSFFVGFAVGYALRAFVKLSMIFLGLVLLVLFGLEYVGWITVNWEMMRGFYDNSVDRVSQEFGEFKSFITGSLPTAGLATLGLYTGFRRR